MLITEMAVRQWDGTFVGAHALAGSLAFLAGTDVTWLTAIITATDRCTSETDNRRTQQHAGPWIVLVEVPGQSGTLFDRRPRGLYTRGQSGIV